MKSPNMTQEEKAKRYDEAIQRANEINREHSKKGFKPSDDVLYIFPELKESEDEMIRNKLLSSFKGIMADADEDELWYGMPYNDIIAWLEEQGKIAPTEDELEALRIAAYEPTKNWSEKLQSLYEKLTHCEQSVQKPVISYDALREGIAHFGITQYQIDNWLKKYVDVEKQHSKDDDEDTGILHRFSFYSYKDEPNILYLAGLYVNEECRNRGIGTKILEIADEVAKRLNCHTIRLKTKKDSNAERLYRKHGYNSLATEERDEIWLEKQGEQETLCDKCRKEQPSHSCQDIAALGRCAAEHKQKSDNKVESKFKVGDWILIDNDNPCQIESISSNGNYVARFCDTGETHLISRNFCNSYFHLWTVQDAKDGDVLCTYECNEPKIVFILKGTPKKHYALGYYCYYNIMYPNFETDSEKGCLAPNEEDIKPATKEQRDLLFQKMKDAGYEWHADEKELFELNWKPSEK